MIATCQERELSRHLLCRSMLRVVALVSLSLVQCGAQLLWMPSVASPTSLSANLINLTLPSSACIYDDIELTWRSQNPGNESITHCFGEMCQSALIPESIYIVESTSTSALRCKDSFDDCELAIDTVMLVDGKKLEVTFNAPTSEPRLLTRAAIAEVFDFTPALTGHSFGDWQSSERLIIDLDESYASQFIAHYIASEGSSSVSLKPPISEYTAKLRVTPSQPGTHTFYLLNTSNSTVLSFPQSTVISSCERHLLPVMPANRVQTETSSLRTPPRPAARYKGILPTNKQFTIPSNQYPFMMPPDGEFHSIFYKGEQGGRTPSVWLLPTTHRLALRSSTGAVVDLGADSTLVIPRREWTLLTFTFENRTADAASSSGDQRSYVFSVYRNAELDISIGYSDPVLGNTNDLSVFGDPSHTGALGLASDIIVWDKTLSAEHVSSLYMHSHPARSIELPLLQHGDVSQENWMDVLLNADTTLSNSADSLLQIAYSHRDACDTVTVRRDAFAEAAEMGSAQGLYYWALLGAFGTDLKEGCGVGDSSGMTEDDASSAFLALCVAVEDGVHDAIIPLITLIQSGLVSEEALNSRIPHPRSYSTLANEIVSVVNRSISQCPDTATEYSLESTVDCTAKSSVNELIVSLLHLAAMHGVAEADQILAYRYSHGVSVTKDLSTAVIYAHSAAAISSDTFHTVGGQPASEADRITDITEKEVLKGNTGEDDAYIQHEMVRAREGHVPTMGDLYYYGARGLPRDQVQAMQYYSEAAALQHPRGQCALAAMLLKGEGGEKNVSEAIRIYEQAASNGSVTALNGLGYVYFFGNETKAYHYFRAAADTRTDGDALFNAGYCLEHGMGTEKSATEAAELYVIAATQFGHFDAVRALGSMHRMGVGVVKSDELSMKYYRAANDIGPWVRWIRRGFNSYVNGDMLQSALCYMYASELGFEVAMSNAAYVLRRHYQTPPLMVRQLYFSSYHGQIESYHHLGDYYSTRNMSAAVACYTRASSANNAMSTWYLAVIHHFGVGVPVNTGRAERYYKAAAVETENAFVKYAAEMLRVMARHHKSFGVGQVHTLIKAGLELFWRKE